MARKSSVTVLYTRRWIFLGALAFMNMLQTFATLAITQVNNIFVAYFSVSYAAVDWGAIGNFAGEISVTLLTAWLVYSRRVRVRGLIITCSLLLSFGLGLMTCSLASPSLFFLLIVGQVILGVRNSIALAAVPAFTVQWFPDNEAGTSFAMFLFGASFGLIMGVILPGQVMQQPPSSLNQTLNTDDWLLYDRNVALYLYGVPTALSLLTLALFVGYLTERPPTPPTLVQAKNSTLINSENLSFKAYFHDIKQVFCNSSFMLATIAGGILLHASVIEILVMSQMFREMFAKSGSLLNPDQIGGYCVALYAVGALIGAPISATIANRLQRHKLQVVIGCALCCLAASGVLLGFQYSSIPAMFASNCFFGFSIRIGAVPVMELVTQSTFPLQEAFVGSFYVAIQALESIALAESGRAIFTAVGSFWTLVYQITCLVASLIVAAAVNPVKSRSEEEKNLEQESSEATSPLLQDE